MNLTRRQVLSGASATVLAFSLAATPIAALAQTVDLEELLKAGPLKEMILGSEDAPVTIVEYASMTCGHCANFHKTTYPHLKENYIDTGKVRFIFREFPLDPVASAAFMLARCAPEEKYFDIIDTLFDQQRAWAFTEDPYNSLLGFAKQMGFTQESFDACLTNQSIYDGINQVRDRASKEFEVNATPTFFINGTKESGALSIEQLDEAVAKHM